MNKSKNNQVSKTVAVIVLSVKCNENCYFCNTNEGVPTLCSDLESVKNRLIELKNDNVSHVHFSGGEPTINPMLFPAISIAKEMGFKIGIQTNGTMASYDHFAEKLKESGITDAFVSLHAHNKKINDAITRLDGSFDMTVKGIKNLINLGIRVQISYVINLFNYEYTKKFLEFNKNELGNLGVTLSYSSPNAYGWQNKWVIPKITDTVKYITDSFDYAKENKVNVTISDFCGIPLCFLKGYEEFSDTYKLVNNFNDKLVKKILSSDRVMIDACKSCKWYGICTGIWKNYVMIYSTDELVPVIELE